MNLGAIILAGGKSLRMGQDKALLAINGKTLLENTCEIAKACEASPILIVTPWTERYKSLKLLQECEFINESFPKSPLSGFALGLSKLKTDWVLLLACDLPKLRSDVIKVWSQKLGALPPEAIAYLPKQIKGWEPLCGFYRCSCLAKLEAYIKKGEYSFQGWLVQSVVIEIPEINSQILFNCNTPLDYTQSVLDEV